MFGVSLKGITENFNSNHQVNKPCISSQLLPKMTRNFRNILKEVWVADTMKQKEMVTSLVFEFQGQSFQDFHPRNQAFY